MKIIKLTDKNRKELLADVDSSELLSENEKHLLKLNLTYATSLEITRGIFGKFENWKFVFEGSESYEKFKEILKNW